MTAKSSGQAALSLEMGSDGVAFLIFDQPESRVTVLSSTVLSGLDALLGQIETAARSGQVRAVVVRSGKDGSFIAGADINEIAEVASGAAAEAAAREGQRIFRRLDLLPVPTVAAVDGLCLGGGTELILACDVRIASDRPETKIGLPEVRLGIIPGFGGTTRLPRIVGLRESLGLILTGATVSARKAHRIGLISERMHPAVLYERARTLALEMAQGKRPARAKRPLLARVLDETRLGRRLVLKQARAQVLKESAGHYPAPLAALDVIRRSVRLPLEAALEVEAAAVGKLVGTDVSRSLIHVFRLMESAKKAGPRGVTPRPVERVAVVGAGVMGGGIAQLLAYRDVEVRLKDIDSAALGLGLKHARELFERLAQRGRLEKRDVERYMGAIAPTLDYSGFGTADLVIEAIVERMEVKQAVLREVETHASQHCVLSTNTSSLSVSGMQSVLARPENFAGMHFFNPVHRMPLVEVVRGERTSDEAVATVVALTRRLDKTPIVVRDGPGFLVNRVLAPYLNEAGWLLAEGGAIDRIDAALREFGMPMGPLRLLDEIGLDVARHAGAVLSEAFGERLKPPPPITALAQSGLTGRKGGRGFYRYARGREEGVNNGIYSTLADAVARERRAINPDSIRERCLLAMVNEAARVLEDGIVAGAGDVDLGMITGTGFPPFRGGLLRWADGLGMRHVLTRLLTLESSHGPRFTPAPLVRERAAAGASFYEAAPAA
jgi:3-hydroxyacyl-CoA dehydrogenase / enoyl-CoA hydratase / 3-hydroxybutyryl-CoA epimerase